jgi:serine/threonine-protein kinase RsbW
VRLARLVTSGVATGCGFDVEEVEDLRIAVDELCAVLLGSGARDVLRLAWRGRPGEMEMTVSARVQGEPGKPDELSLQVLAVVVDSVERADGDGTVSYRVVRRREATGGG